MGHRARIEKIYLLLFLPFKITLVMEMPFIAIFNPGFFQDGSMSVFIFSFLFSILLPFFVLTDA